jgi:hypothetical protein
MGRQAAPNTGPTQGNRTIHRIESEPVWVYPSAMESFRVTVQRMQ